jgi:hypothetical protein
MRNRLRIVEDVTNKHQMKNNIEIGNIYNGIKAGRFVVIALREIGGEQYAQVKPVGPQGQLGRGEMALPIDALKSE